jgi:glycosyltransferase involved in cell wall biosynthesis
MTNSSRITTLRICHLAKYYPPNPGGIETHVQTLALAQVKLGAEVTVICVNDLDAIGNISVKTRTVQEFDGKLKIIRIGRALSIAKFDLCPEFLRYFTKLTEESYDIVHLHTPNPTMLVAWLSFWSINWFKGRQKISLLITHHSDIIKQRILKYGIRLLEYCVYRQSECILTTSTNYIEGSKFLRSFKKVEALPLGLDCSLYKYPSDDAIKYAKSLKDYYGDVIWISVGRLVYYKGLHIAIKALAYVPGKLLIVGIGALAQELKALVKELNLEDRVVWLGKVSTEDLIGVYHAATALWFPSNARSEGYGLVQVEAMASGCPVINADIPCSGVTWVSRHNCEGLTIPLNDHLALAKAAQSILDNPKLRDRLVRGAEARLPEFDHMTMAKRSFEIYYESLGRESSYPKELSKTYQKSLPKVD